MARFFLLLCLSACTVEQAGFTRVAQDDSVEAGAGGAPDPVGGIGGLGGGEEVPIERVQGCLPGWPCRDGRCVFGVPPTPFALWARSPDDVWIAGGDQTDRGPVPDPRRGYVAHYDGASWAYRDLALSGPFSAIASDGDDLYLLSMQQRVFRVRDGRARELPPIPAAEDLLFIAASRGRVWAATWTKVFALEGGAWRRFHVGHMYFEVKGLAASAGRLYVIGSGAIYEVADGSPKDLDLYAVGAVESGGHVYVNATPEIVRLPDGARIPRPPGEHPAHRGVAVAAPSGFALVYPDRLERWDGAWTRTELPPGTDAFTAAFTPSGPVVLGRSGRVVAIDPRPRLLTPDLPPLEAIASGHDGALVVAGGGRVLRFDHDGPRPWFDLPPGSIAEGPIALAPGAIWLFDGAAAVRLDASGVTTTPGAFVAGWPDGDELWASGEPDGRTLWHLANGSAREVNGMAGEVHGAWRGADGRVRVFVDYVVLRLGADGSAEVVSTDRLPEAHRLGDGAAYRGRFSMDPQDRRRALEYACP